MWHGRVMDEQNSLQIIGEVIAATGLAELLGGAEHIVSGLQQAQVELARVGLDVQLAKARGTSLAIAAQDFDNYPALARLHSAVEDMLRWSMPPGYATGP